MTEETPGIKETKTWISKTLRMWPAWVVSLLLLAVIYEVAPQQLGLIAYKALFLTLGAVVGYWVHVWALGHVSDSANEKQLQHARYRRTAFIVGAMIAFALAA